MKTQTIAPATTSPPVTITEDPNTNYMEARHADTGVLLGTATRSRGRNDDEWIGWWVQAGRDSEVVIAKAAARCRLTALANARVRAGVR